MLDCFCGLGGVSDGFAKEGFEVLGIDIVDMVSLGYKHKFIQTDVTKLDGKDYQGYDVIWGSPPCRDFSNLGQIYGKYWKKPPNVENGLIAVKAFLQFAKNAEPKIWIMENVANLSKYLDLKPMTITKITKGKNHVFYGNCPPFLMPRTMYSIRGKTSTGRDTPIWKDRKLSSWLSAKIPLACSLAFARACKETLEVSRVDG